YKDSEQHQIVPSLAHGYLGQKPSDVFPDTCLISPLFAHDLSNIKPRVVSHGAFMWRSARWLSTHAHQYDVFHGLGAYEYSVRPAVIAERAGLPAVVKVAQHNADLASKKGLSSLFGLVAKRRRLLAEISGVIAISNEIRNELL